MPTINIEQEVITYTQELIRVPGFAGDLAAVAEVVARKMRALGFDEVWQDETGNVIGVRRGSRPGPRLVFDAHMDTVEVGDRAAWKHEPFSGELSEGRLWGRGAIDDKGSLAAFTVALASLPREEIAGEVYAVASIGEELLEGAALEPVLGAIKPDGVIIAEPTDSRLGIGHKGRSRIVFSLYGKAAHSSSPEDGENAIDKTAEAVKRVRQVATVDDPLLGRSVMEPIQVISTPYPSASTIPYLCQVVFDRRMVRGETRESVLEMYRKAMNGIEGWSVEFDEVSYDSYTGKKIKGLDFHPAWVLEPESQWVLLGLQGLRSASISPISYRPPYCTNGASSAGERGIPTILFGPGSVHLAHVPDEYAEVDELVRSVYGYMGIARAFGQVKL